MKRGHEFRRYFFKPPSKLTPSQMISIYNKARSKNIDWRTVLTIFNPGIKDPWKGLEWDLNHVDAISQSTKSLTLSKMKLSYLPSSFPLARGVLHLDLSDNHLHELNPAFFENFPDLVTLNLSNNCITEIDWAIFSCLPKLVKIDLSSNPLKVSWIEKFKIYNKITDTSIQCTGILPLNQISL